MPTTNTGFTKPKALPLRHFRHPDGRPCFAIRLRGQNYCYFHRYQKDKRPQPLAIPAFHNPDSIKVARQLLRWGKITGHLDRRSANCALYILNFASNLLSHEAENADPVQ